MVMTILVEMMKDVVLLLKCIALVCVCGVMWNVCARIVRR
jgi:hypothetical protein